MTRVLIVDDKPENLDQLTRLLQGRGCDVEDARHGAEALARARQHAPDLVIADLLRPLMDGYSLLRQWKADARLNAIPFIVYTDTYTEPQDEQLALDLGADAFILKPTEPEPFMARMHEVLARHERSELSPPRQPVGEGERLIREYRDVLIRTLEEKTLELEQANRDAGARATQLRAIFDAEPECVTQLAADGSLLDMNPAGLRMLEADTWQQVEHQSLYPFLVEEHRDAFRDLTTRVFRGESGTLEFQIVGLKGSQRWLETHATPLRDEHGAVTSLVGITRDITERKRADEVVRLVQWQREELIATVDGIVWESDAATFRITFVSQRAERILGYPSSRWTEEPTFWSDHLHPNDREEALRYCAQSTREKRDHQFEYRMLAADGRVVWLRDIVTVVVENDRPAKLRGIMVDITEQKQAEQRIRQLNRTYAVLSDINQLIVRDRQPQAILDGACRIAVAQGGFHLAWIGLAGAPAGLLKLVAHAGATPDTLQVLDQFLDDPTLGCVFTAHAFDTGERAVCNDIEHDPKAAPWREAALQRGYRSMASFALTVAGRHAGTFNLYAGEPGFFDAEELRLLDELAVDIAFALDVCEREQERQRTQEELRVSEERFRELAETIEDVFWVTDPAKERILYVSPAYERTWGRTSQSLYDQPHRWLDTIHPGDRERVRDAAATRQAAGTYDEEYRIVRPDGDVRWVRDRAFPVRNAAGQIERVVGVARDVTERRTAEDELHRREDRFRSLIEHAADMISVINHEGVIRFQSPSAETILGYRPEEMIGRYAFEIVHHDDLPQATAALHKALSNPASAVSVEYRLRHRDGQWRILQTIGRSIPDQAADGFVVLNSRDITDSRQLEEQFRQSQKMEAIGQLAGGIAHDFNNLLTVITGIADVAVSSLKTEDPLHADLLQIRDAGDRAAALTRQLLAFGRRQIMKPEVLNVSAVVTNMQRMLHRLIGEDITLAVVSARNVGNVRADRGQIEQVIMNLVVNARDAMPNGGALTIETQNVALDAAFAAEHPSVEPGPHVLLAVSDTGAGMDDATRMRIFEPFFTTKEPARGTGLGLSTVYGIVKQSGGSIWVFSEPGRGTAFKVYLPRVDETAPLDRPAHTAMAARGTETILIVEDEAAVRSLASRFLQSAGYTVVTASSGAEALVVLERHDGPVHLMLTDVVMPGMTGPALAARLANTRPRMKVLYTSGYTDDAILRHGVLDDDTYFVGKPYTTTELCRKVREVLDSSDPDTLRDDRG